MPYQVSAPEFSQPMQRVYTDLKGVDFSSIPSRVASYRSPDAKNVYKDYLSELGQAIETRPGIMLLGNIAITLENLLANWDFSDGTDNWTAFNLSDFDVTDCIASGTATAQNAYMKQALGSYTQYKGHKIYCRLKAKSTSSSVRAICDDGASETYCSHCGNADFKNLSLIHTVSDTASYLELRLQDDRAEAWDDIYLDQAVMIDLTACFGKGNEPDPAAMDAWVDMMLRTNDNNIYGIHVLNSESALIHCGERLYIWNEFPKAITEADDITYTSFIMNKKPSSSFTYRTYDNTSNTYKLKLYVLDGDNYLEYDGEKVSAVEGYIPTTSIGASPDGSGRTAYQGVNYISDYRKNTFSADGTATYCLDTTLIDSADDVTVKVFNSSANQWDTKELTTDYTVSTANGTITFTEGNIPQAPSTPGSINVEIAYKKHVSGYAEHILGCTLCKVFDNRVFLSGNDDYKSVLFHSELDNPTYFSDENWYFDGADNTAIKSIVSASDKMVCIKEDSGEGVKVYYHTVSYDSVYGSIYPVSETEIHLGACGEGINFRDTIVYLSKQGLESIYTTSQLLHKSSLADTKLINEADLNKAKLSVWNNYLCILVDGKIYLADSRQQTDNNEYEWYYWDNIGIWRNDDDPSLSKAVIIKEYDNELYFGTQNGHIFTFGGMSDYFEETDAELLFKESYTVIENIALNGNFSKKEADDMIWDELENAEISIENNVAKIECAAAAGIKQSIYDAKFLGKSVYVCAMVKSTSDMVRLESYDDAGGTDFCAHSGNGTYEFLSLIKNVPAGAAELDIKIYDSRTNGWDNVYVQNVIAFDLSEVYGENIPEKSKADEFINSILTKYSISYFQFAAYSSDLFEITAISGGRGRIISVKGKDESAVGYITIRGLGADNKEFQENIAVKGTLKSNTVNEYVKITDIYSSAITGFNNIAIGPSHKMIIENYWTTPMDIFNTLTHLKTTNKNGGVVQVKRIPNSIFKIDVSTDKETWKNILSSPTTGFDFTSFNFTNLSLGTGIRGLLVFKVKKRKIKQFSLKFYSDMLDKPMGVYEATIEFSIGNYIKN